MMMQVDADKWEKAQDALCALRGVSDLLASAGQRKDMHLVNPMNLDCIISMIADQLEESLKI